MNQVNPLDILRPLQQTLQDLRWRLPVLLEGDAETVMLQASAWATAGTQQILWLSSRAPQDSWRMEVSKANHELGREADVVVVDCFDGVAVDAIAAVAGVVRAGGLMLFLAPPLAQWRAFDDPQYARLTVEPYGVQGVRRHFLTRLSQWFATDSRVLRLSAEPTIALPAPGSVVAGEAYADALGCRTRQQYDVVGAITALAHHHKFPPLVVRADRGRGKSAALGIAAASLMQQGLRMLVTAPRPEAAETLLRFARQHPQADSGQIQFVAPDALLQTLPVGDVLLVDEAAAIAPSMLETMLGHYPRVVLATTVQGYEGTGQGFLTRFSRVLDHAHPGWRTLELTQPIRWAAGDPLESFIDDILLLNACDEPVLMDGAMDAAQWTLQELTPQLAEVPEDRLRAVHGLLVSAHYRTRPSDFRTLMDGPNIRTWQVLHRQQVIAVAMVAEEGDLPPALAEAVLQGQRRPHGHVLAQSLAVHLNVAESLRLKSWRIVRIAVHGQWQRKGVGRWLLAQLQRCAQAEAIPLMGSLFAATTDVLAFWQQSGFDVVRLGISRESTSGAFPALVVKAVDEAGQALADQARQRFEQTLLATLPDVPDAWPAALILEAWQQARFNSDVRIYPADVLDIQHFIAGHKTYENAAAALYRHTQQWFSAGDMRRLAPEHQQLVVGRILQKQSWKSLIRQLGYSGQKQIRTALREAVALLYRQ